MRRIKKILWLEGDEVRSLKNVEEVEVDDLFVHVRTEVSLFCVNRRNIIKIEYEL